MKSSSEYYTYMLECADGSFYTGITNDLKKRIRQHNGVLKGGARYTSSKRPVLLKYFEKFESHRLAAQREYELKQLTHIEKQKICSYNE